MEWTRGDTEGQKDETATEAGGISAEVRGRGWSRGRVGDLGVQSWGLPSAPCRCRRGAGRRDKHVGAPWRWKPAEGAL